MKHINFKDWLQLLGNSSFNDIYDLYKSIEYQENIGKFSFSLLSDSDHTYAQVISKELSETLVLSDVQEVKSFLAYIESTYASDLGMDSEYIFRRYATQQNS